MNRTILLADDSLTIQKVVELTFADTDYEVVAVSSGDELLQRLPECQPDLVICDVIMPGRDGYDVCQEIKLSADFLHVPVILLTGTFEPFDRDRALAAGCSEIITKPFEARKLVEAVDRLSSAADAAPPLVEAPASDVEVIPPPPVDAPEEADFSENEMEFEDTVVTTDDEAPDTGFVARSSVDGDVMISTEEDLITEEEFTEEIEDGQADFELDQPAAEDESPVLPGMPPPAAEGFSEAPNAAETVATTGFSEMAETTEDEVFANQQAPDQTEDPFPAETVDEEVFPSEALEYEEAAAEGEYVDSTKTTPIDVGAVMAEGSPQGNENDAEIEDESAEVDMSDADTQDITEKVSNPEHEEEPGSTGLSDDDVDRIARRLLELAGDRIEHIAWDVIPDMAELVVRERVREIEAAANHQ